MVVIYHAMELCKAQHSFGASGVDIFFVISGFVMAISYLGKTTMSVAEFACHRLIRIVPLYWSMTCLALIKLSFGVVREGGASVQITPAFVITSFLFIPYKNSLGDTQPVLPPGWTLNYEMFFYLLFALALLLKIDVAKFLTPVMLVLVGLGFFYPAALFDAILVEFLAGLLLGYAVHRGFNMPTAWACLSGIFGIVFLFLHGPRVATWGLSAFFIVQCFVMLEGKIKVPASLIKLGDISFSLYLSHYLFIAPLVRLCTRFNLSMYSIIDICLLSSIFIAVVVYRYLETPLTGFFKRKTSIYIALAA